MLALAVNSGLVAFPISYDKAWSDSGIHLWQPRCPEGYIALGCLATPTPDPPAQTAMVCVHHSLGIEAPLGQCLAVKQQEGSNRDTGDVGHLSESPGANVWCVDNSAATFTVCTAEDSSQPKGNAATCLAFSHRALLTLQSSLHVLHLHCFSMFIMCSYGSLCARADTGFVIVWLLAVVL